MNLLLIKDHGEIIAGTVLTHAVQLGVGEYRGLWSYMGGSCYVTVPMKKCEVLVRGD